MKRKELKKYVGLIVRVRWVDAVGLAEWRTEREVAEIPLGQIVSVAFVVSVTKIALHIAADRDEFGNYNSIGAIPVGWVRSIERLIPE